MSVATHGVQIANHSTMEINVDAGPVTVVVVDRDEEQGQGEDVTTGGTATPAVNGIVVVGSSDGWIMMAPGKHGREEICRVYMDLRGVRVFPLIF